MSQAVGVKILDWCGYRTVTKWRYVYSFWQNARTWRTHTQADRQRPHDDIGCACIASCGKNEWIDFNADCHDFYPGGKGIND